MKDSPLLDQWRAATETVLSERGRKAELARHLAQHYGGTARTWEVSVQRLLKKHEPRAEVLLAIDRWIASLSS